MRIKAVIFDLFGTLIDTFSNAGYRENLEQMAKILGADVEKYTRRWNDIYEQRVLGYCHCPDECNEQICRFLKIKPDPEQFAQANKLRINFVRDTIVPRPGVIRTLNQIKAQGYKIGLLSDCTSEIPDVWRETEFESVFDTTTFSSNEAAKKPMPRIYILTAERLDVDVTDCLYVGDGGSLELTGAERIGMHPIRIRPDDEGDVFRPEADPWEGTTIREIPELLQILSIEP